MDKTEKIVRDKLFSMQDKKYRDFHSRLMPTVSPDLVIGVRTPMVRKYAAELSKTEIGTAFLTKLPHKYYEENNLHAFLLEKIDDIDECFSALDAFLPYVDNWATCDSMSPKVFKKHPDRLLLKIREWVEDNHTYTVRFGIEALMTYFLDENFSKELLEIPAAVASEEYYIKMMVAWFYATALAKRYDETLPYLEEHRLEKWTHNKTIRKAIESFRITDEQKEYLRTLTDNR